MRLVIGEFLLLEETDGDLLTESHRLCVITPPVHTGGITAQGDVRGELVQLTTDGELRWRCPNSHQSSTGGMRLPVWGRKHIRLIKKRLEDGHTRAGHGGMSSPIGGVGRGAFREYLGQQVCII